MIKWASVHASVYPSPTTPPPSSTTHILKYTPPGSGTLPSLHMRTNRTCNLVVLVLLLIGARLALSPTLAAVNTAMAMAMVVTDDDVGLVRGHS